MKLLSIPEDKYDDYRLDVIFDGYKWDPQFLDNNTIAKHVLVMTEEEHQELKRLTEQLAQETMQAEEILNRNLKLAGPLALPKEVHKELKKMKNYQRGSHVRLLRFDFHPTVEGGWAVSEVNSDVPGGFAEASVMPALASGLYPAGHYRYEDFGAILTGAIADKTVAGGRIMLVHCTCYSDDRQVMQYLGDRLKDRGFSVIYAAADHLRFERQEAISILDGNVGKVDMIVRFMPLEWLTDMKAERRPGFWRRGLRGSDAWKGYFDSVTPACNHPIAIFAQTKRFPLVWDQLEERGADFSMWRALLPQTIEVKDVKKQEGFIYKPACGRVGENIAIKEACTAGEYEKIIKEVKKHPRKFLAQKRFYSKPLTSEDGESFHVCVGSFCVDQKAAGYYARISRRPRIDSYAADIPVLIVQAREQP